MRISYRLAAPMAALAAGVGACGSSGSHASKPTTRTASGAQASATATLRPTRIVARPQHLVAIAIATLPSPVQDPATTERAGEAILAGGLDRSDVSVADVLATGGGPARRLGSLPAALHDAAAATLNGRAYVFGGGEPSHDEIMALAPGAPGTTAGHLPAAASDVSAATIGHAVYVVGGYTGTVPLNTIVAWSGLGTGRVVGHLPHPIRSAAVAAVRGRLIIAGGTSGVDATRDVFSFDPATRRLTRIASLPAPLTHAAAATQRGIVYVIGGRGSNLGTQVTRILAIDPSTHRVTSAGVLPTPLSDTGAAALADGILVAGGHESSGAVSDQIYLLRAAFR
jgi:hypothetical protein